MKATPSPTTHLNVYTLRAYLFNKHHRARAQTRQMSRARDNRENFTARIQASRFDY